MSTIHIFVNGTEKEVPEGITVAGLLEILEETSIAELLVEINKQFVRMKTYDTTRIEEGDRIEVLHMAVGG